MAPPRDPFDDLPADLQAQVRTTTAAVRALAGDHTTRPGGTAHAGADHLALALYDALSPTWRTASTSEQIRARLDQIAAARTELDQFTTGAREALDAAASFLGELEGLVGDDERRRAERGVAEARRRQLDAEVDRLAAAEDAQAERDRRARLEAQAAERLGATA